MDNTEFSCFLVEKDTTGNIRRGVARPSIGDLPPGDCLVRVSYSSLNYKDALACQAYPGVVRKLPHVPGIDAAGTVIESASSTFRQSDQVVVTGHELGAG